MQKVQNMKNNKKTTKLILLLLIPLMLFYACERGKQDGSLNLGNIASDSQSNTPESQANFVSMVIQCKEAVEYMKANPEKTEVYNNIVPADGIMLNQSNIQFQQDDTVLDILKKVTKQEKIILKEKGGYVSNIGGLAEKAKAFGEQSGWLYSVNGVIPPNTSVAAYQVKEGDEIELLFVTKRTYF